MKFKSLALLGSITAAATPIAAVVSCSDSPVYATYTPDKPDVKTPLFKKKVENINDQIKEITLVLNQLKTKQEAVAKVFGQKEQEIRNNFDKSVMPSYNEAKRQIIANADDITKAELANWESKLNPITISAFIDVSDLFKDYLTKQITLIKLKIDNPTSNQISSLEAEVTSSYNAYEDKQNKLNNDISTTVNDLRDFLRSEVSTDLADKASEEFKAHVLAVNQKENIDIPLVRAVENSFGQPFAAKIAETQKHLDELLVLKNQYDK